uniref:Potassium channel domain-containing protein n=1 Tax=Acrobeloides nanus TaxID=290746 RepID=A0A914C4I5_9BILA
MTSENSDLSSIVTISKSLPYKSLQDVRRKIRADKAIEQSEAYLQQSTILFGDRRAKDIIRQLRNSIETSLKKSKGETVSKEQQAQAFSQAIPKIAKLTSELASIPEETHINVQHHITDPHIDELEKLPDNISEATKTSPQEVEEEESFCLKAVPYVSAAILALTVLWGGAFVFQLIDEAAAKHPFYLAVFYTLQVACTIGWGDIAATNTISRIYSVAYTLICSPIVFVTFAQMGKLIDRRYTADWQFLTLVVRQKDPRTDSKLNMPTMRSINALVWHTLIVCIINNEWIQQIGVFNSIYFSITSEATIGMGDYLPNTRNFFESCVAYLYMATGITIISSWFSCFSYYYQRTYFVVIRRFLHYLYTDYIVLNEKDRKNIPEVKKSELENGDLNDFLRNTNVY